MLSFIRRLINSKAGVIVTMIVLAVIAISFGMTDKMMGSAGSAPADSAATVGKMEVTTSELRQHAQSEFENARQQQPTLDPTQFVAGGGVDATLERAINTYALAQFAGQQGIVTSKKLIDGKIASLPPVLGPDGKFSQTAYDQLLARLHLTDKQVRADMTNDTLTQLLLLPTMGAAQVPVGIAQPYASLLLEKRDGMFGVIPTAAMGQGATPTDTELATFYQHNVAHYTVPERRVIRYAVVSPEQMAAAVAPTEAEIAQAYQQQRGKYAATEKRTLVQVVIADQAAATALAAKVKAGTPIDAAARAAGLEPTTLTVDKPAYAAQATPDLANAAFGAGKGALIGPIRSALGYTLVRVDAITQVAGQSLEQARPDLVKSLTAQKLLVAMSDAHDKIEDAISNRATFDEIVRDHKLTPRQTPALLTNGINPDDPASKPDPDLGQVIAAGFASEKDDDPQMVPIGQPAPGQPGSFAIVKLVDIVKSAPRKPTDIHDALVRDFTIDRAQRAARQVAVTVVASVNKGTPLAQALAATKLKLPPAQPLRPVSREELAQAQGKIPPPIQMMFSMPARTAKMIEAPNRNGWYIVYLNKIDPGNAAGNAALINQVRGELAKAMGGEYVQQFTKAVRDVVGVKKNAKALSDVKAGMTGQSGQDGSN